MVVVKYPKFVQTGQDNVPTAGASTTVPFAINFDDTPVVVACPDTLTPIMVDNKTTAGFDVLVGAACTIHWNAIYQSV